MMHRMSYQTVLIIINAILLNIQRKPVQCYRTVVMKFYKVLPDIKGSLPQHRYSGGGDRRKSLAFIDM